MTIFSTLMCRSSGKRRQNRCSYTKFDLSSLLEGFESLSSDEHVIVGEEDGSMVPALACQFCKTKSYSQMLALVDENGYAVLYDSNKTGQSSLLKVWQAHNNAIFDLAWMEKDEKLLTASGDQTVILWDARTAEKLDVFKGHTSTVRSVAVGQGNDAVFATGSRDGNIMIWDRRCSKKDGYISPVNVIRNAHTLPLQIGNKLKKKSKLGPARDSQQSVTAVVFQNEVSLVSAGAVDGCVKVWDMRKNYTNSTSDPLSKHSFLYSGTSKKTHGYSSLVLDSSHTRLFASCTDDVIYLYDLATLSSKPLSCFKGHQNNTFYIKSSISPDDQYLLSGSSDELAYIWQIDKPNRSPVILKGHRAEVSDVAWSHYDLTKIATLSDDNTMRMWRMNKQMSVVSPGEATGTAERTHREIGVSVDQSECSNNLSGNSETVNTNITPKKPEKALKSSPSLQHCVSPSIQQWMNKYHNKVTNHSPSVENENGTVAGRQDSETNTNHTNQEYIKRPFKRKLVDDEVENSPSKRRQILKDFESVVNLTLSPKKSVVSPRKCQHLKVTLSPRKMAEPLSQKLNSNTPENSPKICKVQENANIASPLSERTSYQNVVQSPTVNLPNLVFNGEINKINVRRCNKENSPVKGQRVDWLTKIRMNKEGSFKQKSNNSPKNKCRSPESYVKKTLFRKQSDSSSQPVGSQSSIDTSSQSSQEIEDNAKVTPVKGMKSLLHYFQHKNAED